MESEDWYLLLHQIPPKPSYFRAQVLRRLSQVGALPVKNSAYLLPASEETLEDFQWVCREIVQQGGQAWLFRVDMIAGLTPASAREAFHRLRTLDYDALIDEANALLRQEDVTTLAAASGKLGRRLEEIRRIDYFDASRREEAQQVLESLGRRLKTMAEGSELSARLPSGSTARGRNWVTRRGVKVDRIGSAWLIRRFIDPAATFRFVEPTGYEIAPGELRFDMYEGEYTHRGDLCTFEALREDYRLADAALRPIAEIIHDIDLKEQRYAHPETAGVARILEGICRDAEDDIRRIEQGSALFENLYRSFGG